LAQSQGLLPDTLQPASADASFRRYLRLDTTSGASRIVMDAPPARENSRPFVAVAALMRGAGLLVPEILAWDEPQGFMLLSDLGSQTMMEQIQPENPSANHARYLQAVDTLLAWQLASQPGMLPNFDEPLLRRELQLFPDWYLMQHKGVTLEGKDAETLAKAFDSIVRHNLTGPSVYVHRDFMPRNLMIPLGVAPTLPASRGSLPPEGADSPWGGPAAGSAPTLPASRGSLPPEGADSPWDGPAAGSAPTLPASRGSLPPEGADSPWGGPAAGSAPTLPASRGSLPPEGADSPWGGPAAGSAPTLPASRGSLPPEGADSPWGGPAANRLFPARQLGVLDFQDAVYGPISYDIASLMRDAFLSWEEDFVIDITIRYWEKARKAGLMDFEDWHSDFGAFYRAVEWMGLQRHLKVAGIFARLSLRDDKPRYLADTPRFIHYIRNTCGRYRELGPLLRLVDKIEGVEATSGYAFGRV
jgi:hypothetical protein